MIQPNMGLISLAVAAVGLCSFLHYKERIDGRKLRCGRCGSTKMRTKGSLIICKNGHKVTVPVRDEEVNYIARS